MTAEQRLKAAKAQKLVTDFVAEFEKCDRATRISRIRSLEKETGPMIEALRKAAGNRALQDKSVEDAADEVKQACQYLKLAKQFHPRISLNEDLKGLSAEDQKTSKSKVISEFKEKILTKLKDTPEAKLTEEEKMTREYYTIFTEDVISFPVTLPASFKKGSAELTSERTTITAVIPQMIARKKRLSRGRAFINCQVPAGKKGGDEFVFEFNRQQVIPAHMTAAHKPGEAAKIPYSARGQAIEFPFTFPKFMRPGDTFLIAMDQLYKKPEMPKPAAKETAAPSSESKVQKKQVEGEGKKEKKKAKAKTKTKKKSKVIKGSWTQDVMVLGGVAFIGALGYTAYTYWTSSQRSRGPGRMRR